MNTKNVGLFCHPAVQETPQYATLGSAGFDLSASSSYTFKPGEIKLVETGVVVKVPKEHFLAIFARSSLAKKKGLMLANGVGVLDSDYCGANDTVKALLINVTDHDVTIEAGERIIQGVVMPYVRAVFDYKYDPTSEQDRGGVGSTGGYKS